MTSADNKAAEAARVLLQQRKAQGLDSTLADPATLRRLADLFGPVEVSRHEERKAS
jgi:hypothetical protein